MRRWKEYNFNDSSFVTFAEKKKWNKKRSTGVSFCLFLLWLRLWAGPICLRDTSNFPMTDDKISTFLVSYSDKRQSGTTFNSFFSSFRLKASVRLRFFLRSFGFSTFQLNLRFVAYSCRTACECLTLIYHLTIHIRIAIHSIDVHRFIFQRFRLTTETWNFKPEKKKEILKKHTLKSFSFDSFFFRSAKNTFAKCWLCVCVRINRDS